MVTTKAFWVQSQTLGLFPLMQHFTRHPYLIQPHKLWLPSLITMGAKNLKFSIVRSVVDSPFPFKLQVA
jgi:hypothetical protein